MSESALRFREGDFVETRDGLIFDVKGLVHPPDRVVAFVRYIPSLEGARMRGAGHYRKIYDLAERLSYIKKNHPRYLVNDPVFGEEMMEIPVDDLAKHYLPIDKLVALRYGANLSSLERKFVDFVDFVAEEAHILPEKVGISGSLLVGLASGSSDLDLIVYGMDNSLRVNSMLWEQIERRERLKPYDSGALRKLHGERCSVNGISFEDYVFHESRKPFQGLFEDTEFFARYVKDWGENSEAYGDRVYASVGWAKIQCVIKDDSDSLFTPCSYQVDGVEYLEGAVAEPIREVVSFRGRFCQQARVGERVLARGKLEHVTCPRETYYRLVLGNQPEDFMVTLR